MICRTSPMQPTSRSMLPRTDLSASRFCGGRRLEPSRSGGMAHLPVTSPFSRGRACLRLAAKRKTGRALPCPDGGLLLFLGLDDGDLDLGLDLVAEVQPHRVQG